jgi:hypothetical protein
MASYGPVDPHRSYSLRIDDFELKGQSPRRFIAEEPSSTYLAVLSAFSIVTLTAEKRFPEGALRGGTRRSVPRFTIPVKV